MFALRSAHSRIVTSHAYRVAQTAQAFIQKTIQKLWYQALRNLLRVTRAEACCVLALPTLMGFPLVLAGFYLISHGHWLTGAFGAGAVSAVIFRVTSRLRRILRRPLAGAHRS